MDKIVKKGILAVSFGTSVNATREKTIDAIEKDFQEALRRIWKRKSNTIA